MFALIGVTAILLLSIALIVFRPHGLNEARAAVAGAVALLLFRFASFADLMQVTREVADVLLFLVGMMILTAVVERSGLFDLLALWTARAARGSGYLLFLGVFLLGFAITALLSLDVTVLVLTPIVYALAVRLQVKALPYLFVCTFVANTGSLLLPISNLTNLLAYGLLDLGFINFARLMFWPQLAALAVNIGVFFLIFRHQLPRRFDRDSLPARPEGVDPRFLRVSAVTLTLVLLALVVAGVRTWPIAIPALIGGVALAALGSGWRKVAPRAIVGEVSWSLIPFIIGMFTLIRGAERVWMAHLGGWLTLAAHGLPDLLLVAFGTGIGANLVNNIPMIGAAIGLLGNATPAAREPLALAAVLGANLGPTVTPFGSLATLLWLTIVRRKGEQLSTLEYMRVGILTAPPTLLAATVALWLVIR
ncbi:MAG TPA: ArsB/NhaD family transporter [Thermomicrobiales bacterium]|jgi:arsenical pump membrane protein